MKKNLLITFFLTAVITHFSLYCATRQNLSIEARWARLLEINPHQAVPMHVSAAQPAPVAHQHILAVQAARAEELPLEVFFAKKDYEAWQELEQYLKELERRFPFNNHQISEIIKEFAWAKRYCVLTFYLKPQTEKNNPDANKSLRQAIDMFNKFRRAVDQGKEGVPNIIDPIEKYLGDTHYYKNVLVPGNTPPATQSGVICRCCAKVFNSDHMLKRHVRNSHQVEKAHKKRLSK